MAEAVIANDVPALDVAAYLARIGWRGTLQPSFETLATLLSAHMRAIPFENLDVLLGRTPRLDLASLAAKLVTARRGGYCFEHATLFAAVLEAAGFAPLRHTARVTLFVPRAQAARTHMLLTVACDGGRFVVDPGFGTHAPPFPVPLADHEEAPADATHWMACVDGHWVLRARTPKGVVDCWATTLEADNLVDFEVGNFFTSTYPSSPFVNRLLLRAQTDDGYVSVMNRDVTRVHGRNLHQTTLASRAALRALLNERFGFDLPEVLSLRVPTIGEWK
ncbi:MAG TPA: arylamine N-acetyltransferase [Casimicrobiaceae bacterium]|nr:arylamine N-acetyltransferase [Casimicrobiaceae bacterium]